MRGWGRASRLVADAQGNLVTSGLFLSSSDLGGTVYTPSGGSDLLLMELTP